MRYTLPAAVILMAAQCAGCTAESPKLLPARPDALRAHVQKLAADLHPRHAASIGNLDKAADYIKAQLLAGSGNVSEQSYAVQGIYYRNIIARFGPEEGPITVIGAHYDSHDGTPGADDNASGVAALLELSRIFTESPPGTAVELVAYTLEEPPFFGTSDMGSYVHAKSLKDRGAAVRMMIAVEMIGYFSDAPGSQRYPFEALARIYPDTGNFIAVVGRFEDGLEILATKNAMAAGSPLPVEMLSAPSDLLEIGLSDHRNYWEHGYKAVMVTDTAFMRNANYHTATDTPETLNFEKMAQVVDGLARVAYSR